MRRSIALFALTCLMTACTSTNPTTPGQSSDSQSAPSSPAAQATSPSLGKLTIGGQTYTVAPLKSLKASCGSGLCTINLAPESSSTYVQEDGVGKTYLTLMYTGNDGITAGRPDPKPGLSYATSILQLAVKGKYLQRMDFLKGARPSDSLSITYSGDTATITASGTVTDGGQDTPFSFSVQAKLE